MEKMHKLLLGFTAVAVASCSYLLQLDYRSLASEGISLSSIVLAVYVAAMMGLIGAKLGQKLATSPSKDPEYTQLWVLRGYFRDATILAMLTIVASSVILLLPEKIPAEFACAYRLFSSVSMALCAVNLVFMGFIMMFILNRQIWDT